MPPLCGAFNRFLGPSGGEIDHIWVNVNFPAMSRGLGVRGFNRPRSIYQYSNMAPRLFGQTFIFGVVFFVSKSLLGIERQKKL